MRWKPGIRKPCSRSALCLLGLDTSMKHAFSNLSSAPGMSGVERFFDYWPDMAFFLGMLMRTVVHSSSWIQRAAIPVTINKGGMLGEFPAMMSLAGLGIGTAIATYFLSSNLRGIPRQIAMYQGVTNVGWPESCWRQSLLGRSGMSGTLPCSPGISLKTRSAPTNSEPHGHHVPDSESAHRHPSPSPALRWAPGLARPAVAAHSGRGLVAANVPDCPEVLLSPETAPDLVALEQMRLMRVLEQYLENGAQRHAQRPAIEIAFHESRDRPGRRDRATSSKTMVQAAALGELAARIISSSTQGGDHCARWRKNGALFCGNTRHRRGAEEPPGRHGRGAGHDPAYRGGRSHFGKTGARHRAAGEHDGRSRIGIMGNARSTRATASTTRKTHQTFPRCTMPPRCSSATSGSCASLRSGSAKTLRSAKSRPAAGSARSRLRTPAGPATEPRTASVTTWSRPFGDLRTC